MTYLGVLSIPAGVNRNNVSTAVPFEIRPGYSRLKVLASGSDCYALAQPGNEGLAATASTGVSIGTTEYTLLIDPSFGVNVDEDHNVIAVFNNNAASRTVQVWAE